MAYELGMFWNETKTRHARGKVIFRKVQGLDLKIESHPGNNFLVKCERLLRSWYIVKANNIDEVLERMKVILSEV